MIGTRADQDWDGSRQRLGVGQPKIRKGVNQIGTGAAQDREKSGGQDWEKSGTKIGTRATQDGTGTQTARLGMEQPKTRTDAAEDWNKSS
jgi:hypothetical protein